MLSGWWLMKSILMEAKSLQREGFVRRVGFKPGLKQRGSYGWGECSESTEEDDMILKDDVWSVEGKVLMIDEVKVAGRVSVVERTAVCAVWRVVVWVRWPGTQTLRTCWEWRDLRDWRSLRSWKRRLKCSVMLLPQLLATANSKLDTSTMQRT